MSNIIKGVAEEWSYSKTLTPNTAWDDPGEADWIELPVLQLLAEGFQKFSEEAQLTQTINQLDASAAKKGVSILPLAYRDGDTFLDDLELAEECHDRVWFLVKPQGRDYRVIGGPVGCLVYVNRDPIPEFGSLVNAMIGFSATGADPGDTWKTWAASGS